MATIYTANEKYELGTGILYISVVVGNKQKANTLVKLGKKIIVWGVFPKVPIDDVDNCNGKTLYVEVNATDTNSSTDTIPVTITLWDDKNKQVYSYQNDADENGGTVIFDIQFVLS